jgi:hypothetical protein
MTNVNVQIENGVYINSAGYITVVQRGQIIREYLTPGEDQYVKFWVGSGSQCIGKQEMGGPGGYSGSSCSWPTSDLEEAARWMAKRWRMKFYGRQS